MYGLCWPPRLRHGSVLDWIHQCPQSIYETLDVHHQRDVAPEMLSNYNDIGLYIYSLSPKMTPEVNLGHKNRSKVLWNTTIIVDDVLSTISYVNIPFVIHIS